MARNLSPKRVAVVLAGCGHRDGAEVREATFTLLALDQQGARAQCFAPDKPQADVINHLTGEPMEETRNVLVEAARIARGDIKPLSHFAADEFDALIFPGGFGGAKNFSDFAVKGAAANVDPDVRAAVESMHGAGKPIGFICITPASVGGPLLGASHATLTVGSNDDPAAEAIRSTGAHHANCPVTDAVVDLENRLVSTPAYMDGSASPSQVYKGIRHLVRDVLEMVDPVPLLRRASAS